MKHLAIALLVAAAGLTGCKTYVNIPPQAGDIASHDANSKTVRDVMVTAAAAAMAERSIEGPYQVVLPEGTSALTYAAVAARLGDQASYNMDGPSPETPVLEVQQVRIRAAVAEVDLARPVGPDRSELVTAYLDWSPAGGWAADRLRVWRTFNPSTHRVTIDAMAPVPVAP